MAPGGSGKRKRGDRTFSHDAGQDGSRPSPHRPGNLSLAQQSNAAQAQGQQQQNHGRQQHEQRGGGRRRGSRGGPANASQRSPVNSPSTLRPNSRASTSNTGQAQSPPPTPNPSRNETTQTPSLQAAPKSNTAATQTPESEEAAATQYQYEYVIEDRIGQWGQGGKTSIIQAGIQARRDGNAASLGIVFQELLHSGVEGRINPTEAGETIKDILQAPIAEANIAKQEAIPPSDASSLFLDCLTLLAESSSVSPHLPALLVATGISPLLMRRELEEPLLVKLGLVRSTFKRLGARHVTNLLYRQSNYNLLREETEGYSKLITELFTTSSNEVLSDELVEETFERVKGMIGAFDLDVGRVLDVTLDVFAAVLVKQYRFFVKFLRASSWWPHAKSHRGISGADVWSSLPAWALPRAHQYPLSSPEKVDLLRLRDERDKAFWMRAKEHGISAFFELGGRDVDEGELEAAPASSTDAEPSDYDADKEWIKQTGTLPPRGNKVAAQILGFKLRFYSSSARSPTDVLPVNLIYLAALLIKIGFISLRDLYTHLWPADELMGAVREEKGKEKAEKERLNRPGGGAMNALASAGALPDDTVPPARLRDAERLREFEASRNSPAKADAVADKTGTTGPAEGKEELPEPLDQKVQLLKSLLCIGALPEALYMLGRFPWLPDAFPELPEYIHRILHHSLNKVYAPVRPLHEFPDLREQRKEPDSDQSGAAKGFLKLADAPPRKILRWAQLDKDDTNEGTDYRFYWDDWADNIPVCQSIDDVFILCDTLLNYTGVKIGQDPGLLLKLARIGNRSLAVDPSATNTGRWVHLSKRLIVPALSLTKCLPGVVNEVYELIKNFPTMTRYSIYAEWYQGQTSRLSDIKVAFEQVRAETKDVLKRISKTNVKPMARALARAAYSSPGIVFQVAIAQIESYDNLVETVVECARYFTYLSYDVLTWSILSSLGGPGRVRVQQDGMLTSRWLSALSLFAGKLFRRYAVMNPTPILQYVAEQLRQSNPTDLIVLEELTSSMAGIVSDTNFNEAQVVAMAGGELLRAQTMLQLLDKRHESKTTAKRLLHALTKPRLAGQLLILIAQERQTCIFKIPEHNAHLKLLGNLFDEVHRVLTQYLDLLRTNLSVREFDDLVPSVSRLITEFGLEPSVAFAIARPSIVAAMSEHDTNSAKASEQKKSTVQDAADKTTENSIDVSNGEAKTGNTAVGSKVESISTAASEVNGVEVPDVMDVDSSPGEHQITTVGATNPTTYEPVKEPCHPVLHGIAKELQTALPDETWDAPSRSFFVTFWSLSLGDLKVPMTSYEEEVNRLKTRVTAINNDRHDLSIAGTQRKDREKKALSELQERLRAEVKTRIASLTVTRKRLALEKDLWFAGQSTRQNALNTALLEQCFLPRILFSPVDALYSFRMFKHLHSSGTKNFWSMGFLDQIFAEKRLTSILFLCTAKETESLGGFLNEILRDLKKWHADKAIFEKEAYGAKQELPGFLHKKEDDKTVLELLPYDTFRFLLFKWHRQLHVALRTCFGSGEYMHIRNAINVQKAIFQIFPAIDWMGTQLVSGITLLTQNEKREDLKIAATSLLGNLKRREKDWVIGNSFAAMNTKATVTNGARPHSEKPGTPQPSSTTKKPLNPEAAEFQPVHRLSTDGATESAKPALKKAQTDAEDGEIEDTKMADVGPFSETTVNRQEPLDQVPNGNEGSNAQAMPPIQTSEAKLTAQPSPKSETPEHSPSGQGRVPIPSAVAQQRSDIQEAKSHSLAVTEGSLPIPPRLEAPRTISSSVNDGRAHHVLPNRPEAPHPRSGDHRTVERELGVRDHIRDSRYLGRGLTDGPRDTLHERPFERQTPSSQQRGYEHSDRPHHMDRERNQHGWGSEKALSERPALDEWHNGPPHGRGLRQTSRNERMERTGRDRPSAEAYSNARTAELQGQPSRDTGMAPPRSNIPQHPDRAALIQEGTQDRDRPLFDSQHSDRRQESRRYDSHPSSDRLSRTSSPTHLDDRRNPRLEAWREDRPLADIHHAPDSQIHGRPPRYEDARLPTGPRTDRPILGSQGGPQDRLRDSMRNVPNPPPTSDHYRRGDQASNYGSRQQESQYGRLNAGPDIPSGPRLSNGNTAPAGRGTVRNISAPNQITPPQNQPSSAVQNSTVAATEKQTPTGPSSRGPPRNQPPVTRPDAVQSTPPTPTTENVDTAGVHPDRLRAIQGAVASPPASASQNPNHISRPPRQPLPPVSVPPAGQRGQQTGSPGEPLPTSGPPMPGSTGPSPTGRGPPTGPSFGNDRSRVDKRMFAGLQTHLQQAGTPNIPERSRQGASIRGRGGRTNQPSLPSPSIPEAFPGHGDLFANRPTRNVTGSGVEEETIHARVQAHGSAREQARELMRESGREDRRGRDEGRDDMRDEVRRSGRHRSSRDPSRDVGPPPPMPPREDDRPPRRDDARDRVRPPMPPPMERDLRRPTRADEQRRAESDRRDMEAWNSDRRWGIDRRDDRDRRDGVGSGRKRGRGADEGPMGPHERSYGDSKRPRRSN